MTKPDRFYVKPPKPVSNMSEQELDSFAHSLTIMTKQLIGNVKAHDASKSMDDVLRVATGHRRTH